MNSKSYKKYLTSLNAFLDKDPTWTNIIESCYFFPLNSWHEWQNPWGSILHFSKKKRKPRLSHKKMNLDKIYIPNIKYFSSLEEIPDTVWIWKNFINQKEYIYLYDHSDDSKSCKLFIDYQLNDPMIAGYQIIYDAIFAINNGLILKKKWSDWSFGKVKDIL